MNRVPVFFSFCPPVSLPEKPNVSDITEGLKDLVYHAAGH